MTGVLAGIARHARPRGAMETLDRATVSVDLGIDGDYRGRRRPGGLARRQVTLMAQADWRAAIAELGAAIDWSERRANLLVDGLPLARSVGRRLRIGAAVLEVTRECDPCRRMDAVLQGLQAALAVEWRGGVCARVLHGGAIAIGDTIEWELS